MGPNKVESDLAIDLAAGSSTGNAKVVRINFAHIRNCSDLGLITGSELRKYKPANVLLAVAPGSQGLLKGIAPKSGKGLRKTCLFATCGGGGLTFRVAMTTF